jgi:hypothetical protein
MQVKDLRAVPEQSAGVAGQIRPEQRLETKKASSFAPVPFRPYRSGPDGELIMSEPHWQDWVTYLAGLRVRGSP